MSTSAAVDLIAKGSLDQASTALRSAMRETARSWRRKCYLNYRKGRLVEALTDLSANLKGKKSAEDSCFRAMILAKLGRRQEADAALAEARLFRNTRKVTRLAMGKVACLLGKWDVALHYLRDA